MNIICARANLGHVRTDGREMEAKMKTAVFAMLALTTGSSAVQADQLIASSRTTGVRFAAVSITKDQGVRAVISNVLAPANGAHLGPCPVEVSFFGSDGAKIGNTTTVQLEAGASTSVPASNPSKLVRVSVSAAVDAAKMCALRANVEIFDVQTDTTFVLVPGDFTASNREDGTSAVPALVVTPKNLSGRKNLVPVASSTVPLGGTVSPRTPVLAATPSTAPR